MNYPVEILPNPVYKFIDCDLSEHFLIRHFIPSSEDDIIDKDSGHIKIQHICSPAERIDDLSLSLLGIFRPEYIHLEFTDEGKQKYMHYCQPNINVAAPEFELEFFQSHGRFSWCVEIDQLNNRDFDYTQANDPLIATCLVVHTPMKWNYWHFSLRWNTGLGPMEDLEPRVRKNVAKRIGQSVRVVISHFAKIQVPAISVLSQNCYQIN